MALINPHINFNGNAEEAFTFYKSVFGGAFAKLMRFKDLTSPGFPIPEHEANKIIHIAFARRQQRFNGQRHTWNDGTSINQKQKQNFNKCSKQRRSQKIIQSFSEDGQIEMPLEDSPWGSYFGMFRDKYGIEWMVDYDSRYKGQV